jgi:vacuolar protein sorting-associated protein 13A/C
MFEKTLARLLTSALGAYVDDLNAEQLRLGLFGGRLHLRNLRLRTTAFDALQLPIELVGGCIGELDITIPWTSLFSSMISVIVRDVCIVARPQWNLSRVCDVLNS